MRILLTFLILFLFMPCLCFGGIGIGGEYDSGGKFSFSDDFNRADGALGSDWNNIVTGIVILSNAAQKDGTSQAPYSILSAIPNVENGTISGVLNRENSSYSSPALIFRYQDSSNYYYGGISDNTYGADTVYIRKVVSGSESSVATASYTISSNTNYTINIIYSKNNIKLYANSVLQIDTTDTDLTYGNVGIRIFQNTSIAEGKIDDFSVVES